MAKKDFNKTYQWANSLEDPDMQAYAYSNLALRQSLAGKAKSDEWIKDLPEGFIRARTSVGYALGYLWRYNDQKNASLIRQQMLNDELNIDQIVNIVNSSRLPNKIKKELTSLITY